MTLVTVTVNGTDYKAVCGTNLGEVLAEHQLAEMPCGGKGRCGKCRVTAQGKLSPLSDAERRLLTKEEIGQGVRLACRTVVEGNCSVTLSGSSSIQVLADGEIPLSSLRPDFSSYGVAVDIGTTTLAARLYDINGRLLAESGRLNPQTSWGADVISRIDAAMKGADKAISVVTCDAVSVLVTELADKARIQANEVDGMVITGNTVMLHLLTGTCAEPLSHAPFEAGRLFGETITAGELGILALSPDTEIYLPRCAAAFVGADTVTALLAGDICRTSDTRLLVDIGTNGEMALWHENRLTLCSTAAGPAFEGAGITMGMAGKSGAVDHVTVQNGQLAAHVIGDVPPVGICGSGVVDAIACLLETEEIDETGFMENDPATILAPVVLTGSDVRMIQLAKSAIHAGIRTLLHHEKLKCEEITELLIAGGFGSYLDIQNAGKIGLIPEEMLDSVRVVGNAALAGAAMLLLNKDLRKESVRLADSAEVIELSTDPVFAEEYMERMFF